MIVCKVKNFKKDDINITFSNEGDINSYIDEINKWIDLKKWFAKTSEESEYPEDWEDSINNLFDLLQEKAIEQSKGSNVKEAIESVRADYLLKNITPSDSIDNSLELPQGNLPKKQDKIDKKLKDELKFFFRDDRILLQDFQEEFKHSVFGLTVVQIGNNVESSNLITDIDSINIGIIKFLNNNYKKIYNFLVSHGENLDGIPSVMYNDTKKNLGKLNVNYIKLLDAFDKYTTSRYIDISKTLYLDYENKYNRKDHNILDAVYAYLNVRHFNDLLLSGFKNYFYINTKQTDIISHIDNKTEYKYNINRRNSQLSAGWETNTVRDGIKEFGTFSTMILELVPLKNLIGYLSKNEAIISLLKLKYAIERGDNLNLKKALLKTSFSTSEGWKEILELVHKLIISNNVTNLIKASSMQILEGDSKTLKSYKLTLVDLENIESMYLYFFNPQSGIYYIQRNQTFSKGISRNYDIISSVFGSIRSTTLAHYLETVYDYDTKSYVLRVKSKNNSYNDVHNLMRSIENYSILNLEKDKDFHINTNTGEVSVGGITISFKETNSYGIFNISNPKIDKIEGIEDKSTIDAYFRKLIDKLNSFQGREDLLNSSDAKDIQFINLLKFIDKNLTTSFSTGDLGLLTFRTLNLIREGNTVLLDVLLNAMRVSAARTFNIKLKDRANKDISNIEHLKQYHEDFAPYKFLLKLSDTSKDLKLFDDEYWFNGVENTKNNDIFDDIIKAQNIINRQDSKATTKNSEGNSLPNISVYFTDIVQEFYSQGDNALGIDFNNYITKNLLFSGNKVNGILSTYIDNEVVTQYGESKSIDQFTTAELFQHSFVNKFVIPMQNGIFISLPITYSDKKKFLNFPVLISSIIGDKNAFAIKDTGYIRLLMDSVGKYYQDLFKKIVQDYRDIFGITEQNDEKAFFEANAFMKNMSTLEFITLVKTRNKILGKNIKVYKDLHYRDNSGNGLSTNELLYNYINIFRNDKSLENFLLKEKASYINLLLNSYTLILIDKNIRNLFKKVPNSSVEQWSLDGYLVFAKRNGVNMNYGEEIIQSDILSGRVKVNPLLDTYFYMSNVINNNIKLGLVGHELHHKIKALKDVTRDLNKTLGSSGKSIVEIQREIIEEQLAMYDDESLIINPETGEKLEDSAIIQIPINGTLTNITVEEYNKILENAQKALNVKRKAVEDSLYSLLSLALNALFKRTVAIPGTIRPFTQGKLDGITPTYNVAFIEDIKALVYDYKGNYGWSSEGKNKFNDSKDEDAHDGSALLDPFTSNLENNSLDDSEVGNVKKPLWDIDDPIYGARGLIKYAVNAITNKLMLLSKRSNLKLHDLFRKMTDMLWEENEIDLVKDWAIVPYDKKAFGKYIINNENRLFYKFGNSYVEIVNFGKDDTGVYYTEERDVDIYGNRINNESRKVYHLFTKDGLSNHIRVTELPLNWQENYTKINSLYQLHSALGGIYSHSLIGGLLNYSEASNKAVTLFMIYVSKRTDSLQKRFDNSKVKIPNNNSQGIMALASLDEFYQPLKYKLINYVINDSAAKNGVSNINPRNRYTNNEKLNYVTVSTKKYGIQLDSDHEADEAELTEMTQVISALDATGFYHDEVYEIYNAIGELIINSLNLEFKALRDVDPNKLYDLIGKTIINNFTDRRGMIKAVLDLMEKVFNMTTNHKYDKTKCPFSDASLYSKILLTLGSVINKKGIKRTYPGSGMVMVPGYNIYLIWEINGVPMQYEDVLNQAITYNEKFKAVPISNNLEQYYKDVVEAYLNKISPDTILYLEGDIDNFDILGLSTNTPNLYLKDVKPETTLTINYTLESGEIKQEVVVLDSVPKYYEFKYNTKEFLNTLVGKNISKINSIVLNNKASRNLSPVKINFTYRNGLVDKSINIFDSKIYIDLYKATKYKKDLNKKTLLSRLKEFLSNLENNIYTEWDDEGNKNIYLIIKKDVLPAEVIMSNIYRTAFGVHEGDSLYDILSIGPKYFKKLIKTLDGKLYDFDLQLISENGKNNLYVSLNASDNNEQLYLVRNIKWDLKHKNKEKISEEERGNSKVINRVYLMDDDNINQFEIGREIDVSDEVKYDSNTKKFYNRKTNEEITNRELYLDDDEKVVEYFEFVTLNKIIPNEEVSFIKYNINLENLKKVLIHTKNNKGEFSEPTLDNNLSHIINDLYNSDSFLMIQPSGNLRSENYKQVKNIFKELRKTSNNQDFIEYCNNIVNNILTLSLGSIKNSKYIQLNSGNKSIFRPDILEKYGITKTKDNETLTPLEIIQKLRIFRNQNPEFKDEINNLINSYKNSKLMTWNDDFVDKYSKKKFISFKRSLEFISSRIPAQTLLSFMAMKCVGYTGVDTNYCAVSHFQTFLLGSDYDIDKSYMMGLNFDNSGMYYQWSDLFDYSTIETLKASEYLPLSKGYKYEFNRVGIDITNQVLDVLKYNEHTTERILAISKLLKYIYNHKYLLNFKDGNNVRLLINNLPQESIDKIFEILETHESTILPTVSKDLILKNFISSHIQQISNKLGNLGEAYTPVEMEDLRTPAKNTPKSKLAQSLTLFNPAMINIMLFLNMSGKQVTGIAANGLKALFMWRTASFDAIHNDRDIEYVSFNIELEGILNRSKYEKDENYKEDPKTIQVLPDLNITNSDFYKKAEKLYPKISSDNIGSQYISAATDNAKELILACINAGNKMAKCHLYLMALGFDVADIVRFMTSDAVSFIDKITDLNIFNNYNLDINYALTWTIGFMNDPNSTNLKRVPKVLSEAFKKELNNIRRTNKFERFKKDLITLQQVLAGANEFSSFGRVLGINQGVPQTKEDLTAWKNNFKRIIKTAEKKLLNEKTKQYSQEKLQLYGISDKRFDEVRGNNFDVDRWLKDDAYRELTKEYYNHIKESLNIFYFIDAIPHFKLMFRGLYVLNESDLRISIKGKLMNEFSNRLRELYPYAPKNYEKKFEAILNELLIERFLKQMNFDLKVDPTWNKFNSNFLLVPINTNSLKLDKDNLLASYKYIFENYIIPKLKEGTLEVKNKESMYNNPYIREFLNGLIISQSEEIPYYKMNINMTIKDTDSSTRLKYSNYIKGIKALLKYKWGNNSIADLFILYNLIVNKNQYGSERMTELFEDFITDFENKYDLNESYIMKYFRYLGNKDYNPTSMLESMLDTITITDLLLKVAPIVRTNSINRVKRSEPIVKILTDEGIKYYENVGYSNYMEMPSLLVAISGETTREYKERQRNLYKYSFGLPYMNYIINLIESLKSNSSEVVENSIDDLIKSGLLKYTVDCE